MIAVATTVLLALDNRAMPELGLLLVEEAEMVALNACLRHLFADLQRWQSHQGNFRAGSETLRCCVPGEAAAQAPPMGRLEVTLQRFTYAGPQT